MGTAAGGAWEPGAVVRDTVFREGYALSPRPLRVCTDGHRRGTWAKGSRAGAAHGNFSLPVSSSPVVPHRAGALPSSASADAALAPFLVAQRHEPFCWLP